MVGYTSQAGRPARFLASIRYVNLGFFYTQICIEWVDIAQQSRHAVPRALFAFLYKYFDISLIRPAELVHKQIVWILLCSVCNLIYSLTTNVRHPVLWGVGAGAAAFVDLLALLLGFSLVGVNKTFRMSLECRYCFLEVHWVRTPLTFKVVDANCDVNIRYHDVCSELLTRGA